MPEQFNKTVGKFVSLTRLCVRCYEKHDNPLRRFCEKCEKEILRELNELIKK